MFPETKVMTPAPDFLLVRLIASGAMASGIAILVWWIFKSLSSEDLKQDSEWRFDVNRVNELRRIG